MERHIAFLRGINVSGQKIIKMELLRLAFANAGFTDIKTYIQSGNIIFSADIQDTKILIESIENMIEKAFGFRTDVILRKYSEVESLVNSSIFDQMKTSAEKKHYITFLKDSYPITLAIPTFSKNKDVEIIWQDRMEFLSISRLFNGKYGFPNSFIEKLTGVPATTRNPNTLEKILKL